MCFMGGKVGGWNVGNNNQVFMRSTPQGGIFVWVVFSAVWGCLQKGSGGVRGIHPELRHWKRPIRHLHCGFKILQLLPSIVKIQGLRAATPWNGKQGSA